jgi:hypothetical protein
VCFAEDNLTDTLNAAKPSTDYTGRVVVVGAKVNGGDDKVVGGETKEHYCSCGWAGGRVDERG